MWNTHPLVLIGLFLPAALYARGAATYRVKSRRFAAFAAAIVVLFIALISPLDSLGHALFSAHMVQHLLLMMVAAPLVVCSAPIAPLLRGLPSAWRKPIGQALHQLTTTPGWRGITHPVSAAAIHLAALVLWHVPSLYSLALDDINAHILEHISFFASAVLFWGAVRAHADHGMRVLSVFAVMMVSGLLGALMTFAPTAWYDAHGAFVGVWGLTALQDQQLAGLLMWIPSGFVYIVAAGALLAHWLNAVEQRVAARERDLRKEVHHA